MEARELLKAFKQDIEDGVMARVGFGAIRRAVKSDDRGREERTPDRRS
ncbi:hypothetical protein MASR2M78_09710 [Treponema sp.]